MKCSKCGAEIRTGCIYCENCGAEAQIVSEINILEEDLLRSMIEENEDEKVSEEERKSNVPRKRETEKREFNQKNKRKQIRNVAILLVVLAAVCVTAVILLRYQQTNSYDYLISQANEAFERREYQEALQYTKRAQKLDEKNEEVLLLQGKIYSVLNENENAEKLLLQVIEINSGNREAYSALLDLYANRKDYAKTKALYDAAVSSSAKEDILALFEDYLVLPPEFDPEGGSYRELIDVAISTSQNGVTIYYTTDGTVPTRKDEKYKGPIRLTEQGKTIVTAICTDREGNASDPVSAEYEINLPAPDTPKVSPDGGVFTESENITVTVPDGVTVYYVWGDKKPTKNSKKYTKPIEIPEGNNILSLIAVDSYGNESDVLKCNYIYYPE